jgi:hypothetical protein
MFNDATKCSKECLMSIYSFNYSPCFQNFLGNMGFFSDPILNRIDGNKNGLTDTDAP